MRDLVPFMEASMATIIATPLLFIMFTVIIWWVYRSDRKKVYIAAANLPLNDSLTSTDAFSDKE